MARKLARRIVVFLGAGASAPFGYPLTTSLLPAIWKGLSTPRGRGSWRRWAGMKSPADAEKLIGVLQALLPGLAEAATLDGGASIIDVISLVDQMIAEGRSPDIKVSLRQLLHGREQLNKAMNGVLRGTRSLKYAKQLSEWIVRASTETPKSRLSIVSTNYDTVVEHALFNRFVDHGVSIGKNVDLGMPWRDAFKNRLHVRPLEARLALFKLHGSLNWLRCELCGHVTVNVRDRIASLDHWEKRSKRGYNVCWCDGLLRSILVTPSVVRDVRDANLLGIWRAALEDLRLADEWIFIGYSLPREDIAIRSVLLRAWHSRRLKALRVTVVQCERPNDCAKSEQEKKEEKQKKRAETETQRTGKERRKKRVAVAPSDAYKRYRLFFPKSALRESDYERTGVEEYVKNRKLLPENQLDKRIQKFFAGWPPSLVHRRKNERKAMDRKRRAFLKASESRGRNRRASGA